MNMQKWVDAFNDALQQGYCLEDASRLADRYVRCDEPYFRWKDLPDRLSVIDSKDTK